MRDFNIWLKFNNYKFVQIITNNAKNSLSLIHIGNDGFWLNQLIITEREADLPGGV